MLLLLLRDDACLGHRWLFLRVELVQSLFIDFRGCRGRDLWDTRGLRWSILLLVADSRDRNAISDLITFTPRHIIDINIIDLSN